MISKNTVEEITASVAWYLPGTTCAQEAEGRYRIRVPLPKCDLEDHFLTPSEGSDEWAYEQWEKGEWPRGEREDDGCSSLGDTPQEIAEYIVWMHGFGDGTLDELQALADLWFARQQEKYRLKREEAA